MNVIVIGGGIGGLCLAQGLRKAGISVAVYERDASPDARTQGYRLNVEPAGSAALRDCLPPTLWHELVATAGDPGRGMGVFDEQLRLLMRENGTESTDPATSCHAVSRRTLRGILLTGLDDVVRFGKEFLRYEQHPDGTVTAFFTDGTTATGDLLVGADGVRSRVRAQLLPHAEVVTTPGCGVGGKVPLDSSWLPEALLTSKNMILPHEDFLFTAVFRRREQTGADERDYLMWAFVADSTAIPPRADLRAAVSERAAGWHPALRRMITESDAVERFAFTRAVKPLPWHGTTVTLLGDAAHCMPPVGGLGGNTAMRDAQLLCRLVATGQPDAVAAYEAEMLDYGFTAVREASRYLRLAISPSRTLRHTARAFFSLCGKVDPLRRVVFNDS
ncbi:FAD-dependent oxidoreductase [Lentzea nigeriaca]|uniref:FAD-dependent oxidoreductase n=1 Tax=Lentzea nigeriaca TaxID=1128665 RepID=UPI00195D8F8D|nr:NAD(P)/FAD-dependent oxidoreductase [Lentzea nigeriaca]MBM7864363.1 2-polyprenyl-6-methoxyphenol hydroxylase-like FAD-dependent oxidoreductase [Lentzea nigeriaca]